MKTALRALIVLLGIQVLLGAITWWPRDDAAVPDTPLFAFDRDAVTALEITGMPAEGKEPEPVRLEKSDGKWAIATSGGYPADATKVGEVLDKLLALKLRAPIATQATSQAALKVAESDYGRKVTVEAGAEKSTVWLGAALSNAVNVRRDGQAEVYMARGMSEWSVGTTPARYWAPMLVEEQVADVRRLTIENPLGVVSIVRDPYGGFTVDGLPEGATVNTSKLDEIVRRFVNVRLSEPAGPTATPEMGLDQVHVTYAVADGDAERTDGYRVGGEIDGKRPVQLDGGGFVVKVTASSLREADDLTAEALLAE